MEKPWNFKTNPHFYLPTLNTILRLKRFSRNGMKNWRGSPNVTLINACSLTTVPNAEKYVSSHYQIQKQYLLEDQYSPKNIQLKITKRSDNCVNYLPYWCLVSSCNSSSWWLGFVFILEKLLDTLAEINQKLLKIVKMYFIQNLSTFIYLVTFYLKTKM